MRRLLLLAGLIGLGPSSLLASAPGGYVIEWGYNSAFGTSTPPRVVASNTVSVSAGAWHRLALLSDGTVFGWGSNPQGEALGESTPGDHPTNGVVKLKGHILSHVQAVVAGNGFSLALGPDGKVFAWGQIFVPSGLSNVVEIAAEWGRCWALKKDGTVVGWITTPSSSGYGVLQQVAALTNVIRIAAGPGRYTTRLVAVRKDGGVSTWEGGAIYDDKFKSFVVPPAGLSNVIEVAAGAGHSLALRSEGTVVGWGQNQVGEATGVPSSEEPWTSSGRAILAGQVLSNAVAIAASAGYSLALKRDGTVVAWGRMINEYYPVIVPEGLSNVIAISAGEEFCLAITTNSTVAERFRSKR
jgi:alpha-tubulin suppressor-like RCC1 family protein